MGVIVAEAQEAIIGVVRAGAEVIEGVQVGDEVEIEAAEESHKSKSKAKAATSKSKASVKTDKNMLVRLTKAKRDHWAAI